MARRSAALVPLVLLGGGLCWVASIAPAFLAAVPSAPRGRTALRSFKEDFDAWKTSLTPEEQQLISKQARFGYDKKFRKTEEFDKQLPDEKLESFSTILQKFFDNEAEDYQKEEAAKMGSGPSVLDKGSANELDFALKHRIVEVDRQADRRYRMAMQLDLEYKQQGKKGYPPSSPQVAEYFIQNNDTESHENNVAFLEAIKKVMVKDSVPPENRKYLEEVTSAGVPPAGQRWSFWWPQWFANQLAYVGRWTENTREMFKKEMGDKWTEEHDIGLGVFVHNVTESLGKQYRAARAEVEKGANDLKEIYASERMGLSKADVLKELWEELPKYFDKPAPPPLDEEMLAELAEEPAGRGYIHPWGVADMLYKSEAIDAFGDTYLIGIFETQEECNKAFDEWNTLYEKARADQQVELQEWNKFENARLDKDPAGRERIQKVLEEARANRR